MNYLFESEGFVGFVDDPGDAFGAFPVLFGYFGERGDEAVGVVGVVAAVAHQQQILVVAVRTDLAENGLDLSLVHPTSARHSFSHLSALLIE